LSPSTLVSLNAGANISLGHSYIRQGRKDWGDGYFAEDLPRRRVTFCAEYPVQNRRPCHHITLQGGEWVIQRQVLLPRYDHARGGLVLHGHRLYLLGGRTWEEVTSGWAPTEVQVQTQTQVQVQAGEEEWTVDSSPLGQGLCHLEDFCTAWAAPSLLLVSGGEGPTGLTPVVRTFNFAIQEWSHLPDLPEGRGAHGCTYFKGLVLVAGGRTASSCSRCACDSSNTQTWALHLPSIFQHNRTSTTISSFPSTSSSHLHTPSTWVRLGDLVRARQHFHLVHLDTRLLAVGSGGGVVEEWLEGRWQVVEGLRIPGDIKVSPATLHPSLMASGEPAGRNPGVQNSTNPSNMDQGEGDPGEHGAFTHGMETSTILSSTDPGQLGAFTHGMLTETARTVDAIQTDENTRTTNGESTSNTFDKKETSETTNIKTSSVIQETPIESSETPTTQKISEFAKTLNIE